MSDQHFEEQLGNAMEQAARLAQLMNTEATNAILSRRQYQRVSWEEVNEQAAEGWELTAVISDGLHVMQRAVGPADQVTLALNRIMGAP